MPAGTNQDAAWVPYLWAARALALAASSSRFFGGAEVSMESKSLLETIVISSTAAINEASLALEGFANPLIFRTNCRAAARTSSSVTGGWKLNRILMFRHIRSTLFGLINDFGEAPRCGPLLLQV